MGAQTVGFSGFDSGQLGPLVDINLHVPSDSIEHVEDIHLMLEHLICQALRERPSQESILDREILHSSDRVETEENPVLYSIIGSMENVDTRSTDQARTIQDLIFGLSRTLDTSLDQFSILQQVLQFCLKSVDAVSGSILLFDEEEEVTRAALAYMDKMEVYAAQNLADILQQGLAGWVVKNRQPVLVMDTIDDSRWLKRQWEEKNGSRSAISVPFLAWNKVLAVITLVHPKIDWFTQNDLAILASIAMYITIMALAPYKSASSTKAAVNVS